MVRKGRSLEWPRDGSLPKQRHNNSTKTNNDIICIPQHVQFVFQRHDAKCLIVERTSAHLPPPAAFLPTVRTPPVMAASGLLCNYGRGCYSVQVLPWVTSKPPRLLNLLFQAGQHAGISRRGHAMPSAQPVRCSSQTTQTTASDQILNFGEINFKSVAAGASGTAIPLLLSY